MAEPEKVDLKSMDIAGQKREELNRCLAHAFPEVFAEGTIDFDRLKRSLGDWVDPGKERFGLTWPGKADCMRIIQQPSVATLKPMREESVNFDETENVFIEGDNLEVLKLLQKAYFGKIRMIYIDPPYNTGKEFIYPDRYSETLETYLLYTGQVDNDGKVFSTNSDVAGRYHSRWLAMMHPRLYLARNLLREDGLIFVSIDDHEARTLRLLLDEIFGEENFVAQLVWNTEGHTDNQFDVKVNHEYVVVYAKDANVGVLQHIVDPNTREESNLWKGFAENSITKNGRGNPPSEILLPVGFPCKVANLDLSSNSPPDQFYSAIKRAGYISREITSSRDVSYPIRLDRMLVRGSALAQPCRVFSGWANANKLKAFIEGGCKPIDENGDKLSFYLSENGVIYYRRERSKARNIVSVLKRMGTTETMRSELEELGLSYQYPKPKQLLKYLIRMGSDETDIVLDFFAGSGTTAQAIFEVNTEHETNRKFILVQLPEPIEESAHAYTEGFRTISELARERIRRTSGKEGVFGFRAFVLDRSNFRIWDPDVGSFDTTGDQLQMHVDHVSAGIPESLLFELLLKSGFSLATKVATLSMSGKTVFSVEDGAFLICLEDEITSELIDALAEANPLQVVCLDEAFNGNDQLKANAVHTFRARAEAEESEVIFRTV